MLSIDQIISEQSTEGYWSNEKLFISIFKNAFNEDLAASTEKIALMTYLIAKWI